jgi:hypothetical protein
MEKIIRAPLNNLMIAAITIIATGCSSAPAHKKVEQVQQPNRDPDSLAINQLQFFDFQIQYDSDQHQVIIDWSVNEDLNSGSFDILYGKYCLACRTQDDVKVIGSVSATGKRSIDHGYPAYRFVSFDKLKTGDSVFQIRYRDASGEVNSSYKVLRINDK